MPSWAPGRSFAWCRRLATAWWSVSLTRVDLPEPETPVTQQKTPSGIATSIPLRLCSRAPRTSSAPRGSRRCAGTSILRLPERYWPVSEAGSLGDLLRACPAAITWPPCSPAPGPRSTRWSAAIIVPSSCSTTITVLPRSRSRSRVAISFSLSRWCRPIEGSSSTYITPTRLEPIWVARRIRCASPPESERAERSSER